MSLRLRLTLVVAVTFALVVVGCTYAAHLSASQQLRSQTDAFLLQRSTRFTQRAAERVPARRSGRRRRRRRPSGPALADPDAIAQIIDAKGDVVSYDDRPARRSPIDAHGPPPRASTAARPASATSRVSDDSYRMLTAALPNQRRGPDRPQHRRRQQRARHRSTPGCCSSPSRGTLRGRVARLADRPPHRAADRAPHRHRHLRRRDPGSRQPDRRQPARRDRPARVELQQHARRAAHVARAATPARAWTRATSSARRSRRCARTSTCCSARGRSTTAQRDELLGATDVELRELTDLVSELVELATDTRTEEPVQQHRPRRARRARRHAPAAPRAGVRSRSTSTTPRSWSGAVTLLERAVGEPARQRAEVQPAHRTVGRGRRCAAPMSRSSTAVPASTPTTCRTCSTASTAPRPRDGVPGSGLGLAIVEQIAELHGGTVTLAPRAGGGIVARLDLQAAATVGHRRSRPATTATTSGSDAVELNEARVRRARGRAAAPRWSASCFASAAVEYRAAPSWMPTRAKPGATTSATYSGVGTGSDS